MSETTATRTVTKDFIEKITRVYNECVGFNNYGDTVEFFDESGCVLMTVACNEKGSLEFKFAGEDELYDYSQSVSA